MADKLILPRRQFLVGAAAFIAAPAIVRASSIMRIKAEPEPMGYLYSDKLADDIRKMLPPMWIYESLPPITAWPADRLQDITDWTEAARHG